jgi:hypothetical protein
MGPFSVRWCLLALTLAVAGCGSQAASQPETPASTKAENEAKPPNREKERRHVAPPPAYGNKVVLAGEVNGTSG